MSEGLDVTVVDGGSGAVTARVSGEIDLSNVERFSRALETAAASGSHLTVDLTRITYMDSAGVAALFARAGRGPLEIVCRPDSVVAALVEVTRLGDVAVIREE